MWPDLIYQGQTYRYESTHKLREKLAQQALPWIKKFKATAGKRALDDLQGIRESNPHLFDGSPLFGDLPDRVLFECWCADQYRQTQRIRECRLRSSG